MNNIIESCQVKPPTGCVEIHSQFDSVGLVLFSTDAPGKSRKSMGQEGPGNVDDERLQKTGVDGRLFEASFRKAVQTGYDDRPLAECEATDRNAKAVSQLEEALWLAQEELIEEQRQRAEERRQLAIVQDEYLRLQEESASISTRHTAAEVSAATSRAMAADALADKEYFIRLLGKTYQELQCLTTFVERILPQFNTKICELVAQGNTIVALLARRWPEAELRKQVDALGISDQPLAHWALSHALKSREIISLKPVAQRSSSGLCTVAGTSRELLRSGTHYGHAVSQGKAAHLQEPQLLQRSDEQISERQQQKTGGGSRVSTNADGHQTEIMPQMRSANGPDATTCALLQSRQAWQASQINSCPQQAGSNLSKTRVSHNAVLERRIDNKTCTATADGPKDGSTNSLCRSPSAASLPRLQTVTPRRTKLVDAATCLPSKSIRQHLPSLVVGKGPGQGPPGSVARDCNQTSRPYATLPRRDAGGESLTQKKENYTAATPTYLRKCSARKARLCKEEQGLVQRETQGHSSRPASVRSVSRGRIKQAKGTLAHSGGSMPVSLGGSLRATQPLALAAAVRSGSLPSRRTCGVVLSSNKEVNRHDSAATFLKDAEEESFAKQLLRDLSQLVSRDTSEERSHPCQVSASVVDGPQHHKKKLPPLPPSLRLPLATYVDDAGQHSDGSARIMSTIASPETSSEIKSPSAGVCTSHCPEGVVAVLPGAASSQAAQTRAVLPEQSTRRGPDDRMDKVGLLRECKDASVLSQSTILCTEAALHSPTTEHYQVSHMGVCFSSRSGLASENGPGQCPPVLVKHPRKEREGQPPQAQMSVLPLPINQNLDIRRQHTSNALRNTCNVSEIPASAASQDALGSRQKHLPPGTALRLYGEWFPRPRFVVPERSSLPANKNGLQMLTANTSAQRKNAYVVPARAKPLSWQGPAMPERPTFVSTESHCSGMQQHCLLHHHNVRQQQLMYQAQQNQPAFQIQQQAGAGNLHFFVKSGASAFVAPQRHTTWNLVYSGGVGR